ncbi:MAG: phytase [Chloroflexota bacterium]
MTQRRTGARSISRRTLLRGGLGAAGLLALQGVPGLSGIASAAVSTGPGTAVSSYLFPVADGVDIKALLTVRDKKAENGYAMVGIPDGLGIIPGGDKFTLVMNHELGDTVGVARSHGSKGAFVSKWTIDKATLRVLEGSDLTRSANTLYNWNPATRSYGTGTTTWNRFCAADLPATEAYLNGSKGTPSRIFMNGEEVSGGRAWAHIVTGPNAGESWQLPRFGRSSFENLVATPFSKDKTIVIALDDGSINTAPVAENYPCELFVYIGTKQDAGADIERAGLTNGKLHTIRLPLGGGKYITEEKNDFALGDSTYIPSARFELVELGNGGDVSGMSSIELEQDCFAKNALRFLRTEDGVWDPRLAKKNDFYFVTTANITGNSRLWRLSFDDLDAPEKGGTLTALLKGDEGHRMLDNVTMDNLGRIICLEDPGNDPRIAKVWLYGTDSKTFTEIARHDRGYFDPMFSGQKFFETQDEETSGVIDASSVLGDGWFLLVVQNHKLIANTDPDLVEGGQLLAMYVPPTIGIKSA